MDWLLKQALKVGKASVNKIITIHTLQERDDRSQQAIAKIFDDPVVNQKEYSSPKYRDSKWGQVSLPGNYEDIFKGQRTFRWCVLVSQKY